MTSENHAGHDAAPSRPSSVGAASGAASGPAEDPAATRPYYRLLGFKATRPDAQGHQRVELASRPELENSRGEIHGGVVASLLDAAIGVAVRQAYAERINATTVSLTVNYAEPGRGHLIASAEIMRAGGSLATAQARVVDAEGTLVAHAVGTMKILRPKK